MTDLSSSIAVMAGIDSSCPLSVVCAFVMGYLVGLSHRPRSSNYSNNCPTDALVPYKPPKLHTSPPDRKESSLSGESQPQIPSYAPEAEKPNESSSKKQQCLPEQLLHEKVGLQMKKVQSTSFFEMRLEPSSDNRFMRKIQKHELVTDYELETFKDGESNIVPFNSSPLAVLSQPHSVLEVVAHQDYNLKLPSPLFERKFISMGQLQQGWKHQTITPSILQNGRFSKFFRKSKVIGKGAFGSVFGAWSILQSKQYAIKKIVMKGLLKIGEVLKEVSFISKYDHPNIVRYHTCWIELATIDDAIHFTTIIPYKNNSAICQQKEMADVGSNSGFTFEKSSSKSSGSKKKSRIGNEIISIDKLKQEEQVNLIQIYALYIQMELCDGSLHSYLKNRKEVNPQQSFHIISQLMDGIHYLHSNGIVHRDLKPGNILLNKSNLQVKIGDFGLAALIDRREELSYRERVGTPLYIAPQLNGKSSLSKDQMFQVDIFSLGVIYFELLTLLNESTQHERSQKLTDLQFNKVHISSKDLKEQKKFIKLLTKTINRPTIYEVKESKEYQILKEKYRYE